MAEQILAVATYADGTVILAFAGGETLRLGGLTALGQLGDDLALF